MRIAKKPYGKLPDGTEIALYTLVNDQGMKATITNYGGIVVALHAPDREGNLADVVLGFDTLNEYLDHSPFFGCLVGRVGNRIANARFTLEGVEYVLAQNDGQNHLHGGIAGFDKKLWSAQAVERPDGPALKLSYTSPLIKIASGGDHHGVNVDADNLRRLILWVDAMAPYRGTEEVRAIPDPEFQGIDWLALRPEVQNAPTIVRPGPVN